MPGFIKDKLPNRALSGLELAAITKSEIASLMVKDMAFAPNIAYAAVAFTVEIGYTLPSPHSKHEVRSVPLRGDGPDMTGQLLAEIILLEFDRMTNRDFIFGNSGAYRSAIIDISIVVHVADPHEPGPAKSMLTGAAPLPSDVGTKRTVIGLQRVVTLVNPNIDRINHGLPIVVQRATAPPPPPANNLPGEPPTQVIGSPGVENQEFRYDPTQFPPPPPPVDTDISQLAAAKLGVPVQTGV